jgi:hypothetical protein
MPIILAFSVVQVKRGGGKKLGRKNEEEGTKSEKCGNVNWNDAPGGTLILSS